MDKLVKEAFLQVDVLGPHVQEGHYDLIGPNCDIILPSVWEKVVEPDWVVTMTMWPLDKEFKEAESTPAKVVEQEDEEYQNAQEDPEAHEEREQIKADIQLERQKEVAGIEEVARLRFEETITAGKGLNENPAMGASIYSNSHGYSLNRYLSNPRAEAWDWEQKAKRRSDKNNQL
jgi:hypothetical protein